MTPAGVEDPTLVLPPLPELDGELGPVAFPLSPVDGIEPAVEGGAVRVAARNGGLRLTDRAGQPLAEGLRVRGAEPEPTLATPLGLERTLRLAGGPVVERAAVPFSGAVAFFQWTGAREPLRIAWSTPSGNEEPVRWRAGDRALITQGARARLLWLFRAEASFRVDGTGSGDLHVQASVAPREPVLLAVARLEAGATRVPRIIRRPGVVIRGRESRVRRLLQDRLAVEASDAAAEQQLAWAVIGLAAWEASTPSGPLTWTDALAAEASLATGDMATTRRLIAAAFRAGPAPVPALAIMARYLAWTGDRSVAAEWDRVLHSVTRSRPAGPRGDATLAGLARTAADLGKPVPDEWSVPESGGAGARDLGWLLQEAGPRARDREREGSELASARRILRWVRRLGLAPDGARGRLVWQPEVDHGWNRVRVRNLRVGGAVVELGYERQGTTIRFSLRPTRGAPPLAVVLEPVLQCQEILEARVDGAPANLQASPVEGADPRWRIPVQLVLDNARTLDVEVAPRNH